jgi:hypothetical protein
MASELLEHPGWLEEPADCGGGGAAVAELFDEVRQRCGGADCPCPCRECVEVPIFVIKPDIDPQRRECVLMG